MLVVNRLLARKDESVGVRPILLNALYNEMDMYTV